MNCDGECAYCEYAKKEVGHLPRTQRFAAIRQVCPHLAPRVQMAEDPRMREIRRIQRAFGAHPPIRWTGPDE